jgi:hypothetical protein
MKPQTNGSSRVHKSNKHSREEGPPWLIIAAGAVLSTLSIRLGYKLRQATDSKPTPKQNAATTILKGGRGVFVNQFISFRCFVNNHFFYLISGNGKSANVRKPPDCFMQPNGYSQMQDNHGCFTCNSGLICSLTFYH